MMRLSLTPTRLVIITLVAVAGALGALSPAVSSDVRTALQTLGIVSCSKIAPCQTFSNSSTGPGAEGKSAKGFGVAGVTTFNSTSSMGAQAGVFGQDASSSGTFDSGVFGSSKNGIGVQGTSQSGTGVIGSSTNSTAMIAQSTNGVGLLVTSTNSTAILDAGAFNGVDAATSNQSNSTHRVFSGVFGHDNSNDGGHLNQGVAGLSNTGVGVFASSANWIGAHVVGGFTISNGEVPALSVNGNAGNADLIDACNTNGLSPCHFEVFQNPPVFSLSQSGTIVIQGQIFTAGSCSSGCIKTNGHGERRVRFYTPQESMPTVEDFGEGQLVDGAAYVALDPSFANTTDKTSHYMVIVTPEGDTNGLFVASKTGAGFTVRESRGGRSTLAFDYRVVAKPFGMKSTRLPMVTVSR